MDDLVLFLHILGALTFVSGVVVAGVSFESGRRRRQPAEIALLLGLARVGAVLAMAGAAILLVFGLRLVDTSGFGWDDGWIQASLALFALAVVLGAIGGQRPKQARLMASRLAAEGKPESPELRALLDGRLSRAVNYLSGAVVLAILVLMVFKP